MRIIVFFYKILKHFIILLGICHFWGDVRVVDLMRWVSNKPKKLFCLKGLLTTHNLSCIYLITSKRSMCDHDFEHIIYVQIPTLCRVLLSIPRPSKVALFSYLSLPYQDFCFFLVTSFSCYRVTEDAIKQQRMVINFWSKFHAVNFCKSITTSAASVYSPSNAQ